MKHGMTVGTHRAQVFDRIQSVIRTQLRDWNDVVHMDEPCAQSPILFLEI